jgi:hypothetical protein
MSDEKHGADWDPYNDVEQDLYEEMYPSLNRNASPNKNQNNCQNTNQGVLQNVNVLSSMGNNVKLGFGFGCGCLILLLVAFVLIPSSCTVLTMGLARHSAESQRAEEENLLKRAEQVQMKRQAEIDEETRKKEEAAKEDARKEAEIMAKAQESAKAELIAESNFKNSPEYAMLTKSAIELDAAIKDAILKNNETFIKAGISAAIKNNHQDIIQSLEQTPWMNWYRNEVEMDGMSPRPCNLYKMCPTDQVNFITTYMQCISDYEQLKSTNSSELQKAQVSKGCLNSIRPCLQKDIIHWTGRVWFDLDGDNGVFVKPRMDINKRTASNLVIVVSHLNDLDGKNLMVYKSQDGVYQKTHGSTHVIRFYADNIPSTMFNELSKIKQTGQFVKFSGKCLLDQKKEPVWRNTENILDEPVIYFQLTRLEVQPNQ